MGDGLLFYQLFDAESSTFTYLLGDEATREAVIIDAVAEQIDRDLQLIGELGLRLHYILDTHIHADHVTAAGELRRRTGARTGVGQGAKVDCADMALQDGDELNFGNFQLSALATPGHTDSCMSFFCAGKVFTGDALLIRSTGRTDFQQGNASRLYQSVNQKLYALADSTLVYPAHDYKGHTHSTIGLEKQFNARIALGRSEMEFVEIMAALKLPNPKKMDSAVPANLGCGKGLQ